MENFKLRYYDIETNEMIYGKEAIIRFAQAIEQGESIKNFMRGFSVDIGELQNESVDVYDGDIVLYQSNEDRVYEEDPYECIVYDKGHVFSAKREFDGVGVSGLNNDYGSTSDITTGEIHKVVGNIHQKETKRI